MAYPGEGIAKPNTDFYKLVEQRTHYSGRDILLIDDTSANLDIAAVRACNTNGIKMTVLKLSPKLEVSRLLSKQCKNLSLIQFTLASTQKSGRVVSQFVVLLRV